MLEDATLALNTWRHAECSLEHPRLRVARLGPTAAVVAEGVGSGQAPPCVMGVLILAGWAVVVAVVAAVVVAETVVAETVVAETV